MLDQLVYLQLKSPYDHQGSICTTPIHRCLCDTHQSILQYKMQTCIMTLVAYNSDIPQGSEFDSSTRADNDFTDATGPFVYIHSGSDKGREDGGSGD